MASQSQIATTADWSQIMMPRFRINAPVPPRHEPPTRPSTPVPEGSAAKQTSTGAESPTEWDISLFPPPQRIVQAVVPLGLGSPAISRSAAFDVPAFLNACLNISATIEGGSARAIVDNVIASFLARGLSAPSNREKALAINAVKAKQAFIDRAIALPFSVLNTQSKMRPGLLKIFWLVVIASKGLDPDICNTDVTGQISMFKPLRDVSQFVGLPFDPFQTSVERQLCEVQDLMEYYPLPASIFASLSKLSDDINSSLFARYMVSRGKYPPQARDTAVKALLRFWPSTSSGNINEYLKQITANQVAITRFDTDSKCHLPPLNEREIQLAERVRTVLRREAKRVLGPCTDEGLDEIIRAGVNDIAALRRRMMATLKTELDRLLERAMNVDLAVHNYKDPRGIESQKRKSLFINPITGNDFEPDSRGTHQPSSNVDWDDCY
jgi:hypothetical protein